MKQFGAIFRFEFGNYLQNKAFRWTTILLVLIIAGVMFFPSLSDLTGRDEENSVTRDKQPVMLVKNAVSADPSENELLRNTMSSIFPDYAVTSTGRNLADLRKAILDGKAECAFVQTGENEYTYFVDNLRMYDTNTERAMEGLKRSGQINAMVESGLPIATAAQIVETNISVTTETLGSNQARNFLYTYFMIMALYTVIVLYGQMVATSVASEKSSRAMELLVTAANPVSMMFGKILASCLAGFLQLLAVFGSALLFFNLSRSHWEDHQLMSNLFDIPASLVGYLLLFFVLGFLLYAFLYGAMGSTVSKLEDVNMAVLPITLLFVIAFTILVVSLSSGAVDSTLMKVCSYIPFTSPMAMFTRIAMSNVSLTEILISVLILVATVAGVGFLSAKIYRVGVLLYGTRPSFVSLLKSLKTV